MAQKTNEKKVKMPSIYDYFYFDKQIFKEISKTKAIEKVSSNNKINLLNSLRGISYFYELVIIDIINHLEDLVPNVYLDDIVHWSETDVRKDTIKNLKKKEPILKYCFELNACRKQLAKVRMKIKGITEKDYETFIEQVLFVQEKLDEIDKYLKECLKIKRIKPIKDEPPLVFNWFLVKFHYIEGGSQDILNFNEDSIISTFPGGTPFFYLMSPETSRNYHLQNPRIRKHKEEYLAGYKIILIHFHKNHLSKQFFNVIKKDILSANKWHHLHKVYGKIINSKEYSFDNHSPLFKIGKRKSKSRVLRKKIISSAEDLDIVFRRMNNLRIRVISPHDGQVKDQNLTHFLHVLTGAMYIQKTDIEVIEFRQIFDNHRHDEYAYAIFIPLRGMISDASYWLFFDKIALSNENGCKPNGKLHTEILFDKLKETQKYNIQTFKVKGDLLTDYIKNRDLIELKFNQMAEKNKDAKGILAEFVSYLDIAKNDDAVLVDIEKDIKSTDIDIMAETKQNLILIQAKNSFPSKSESDEIIAHFKKATKYVKSNKKIKKVLFLINDEPSFESIGEIEEDEADEGIFGTDMEHVKNHISEKLSNESIEIRYYSELKKKLSGRSYNQFLNKLDKIFDYYKFNEDYI